MTMICRVSGLVDERVSGLVDERVSGLAVYIGDELVGVAEPIIVDDQPLYFLTIQSDAVGTLRFETENGTPLMAEQPITYVADSHHGTLRAPVMLKPDDDRPYKVIENDHVVIIRNHSKYDVTGKKLQ